MTAFDQGKKSKTGYPGRSLPKPENVKDAAESKTQSAAKSLRSQILETAIPGGKRKRVKKN